MTHAPDARRPPRRPLLLLVEDDRDTLVAGAHLLMAGGFDIEIARGGDDGIAKAAALSPDVIVTDILMPHTSGSELCRCLHASPHTRNIPVIIYTGMTEVPTLAGLLQLGVRVFAIKPCVPTVIAEEARALIAQDSASIATRVVTGYGETLDAFAREIEAHALQAN